MDQKTGRHVITGAGLSAALILFIVSYTVTSALIGVPALILGIVFFVAGGASFTTSIYNWYCSLPVNK